MSVTRKPRSRKIIHKGPQAEVKTIILGDAKVNVATSAHTGDTVTVLFLNRYGQRFRLPNGREVLLEGNAVDLRGKAQGVLPYGGYSVNVVDKADWEEVKRLYGKAYKGWFDGGKIVESGSEREGIDTAASNADDDPGMNPTESADLRTAPADIED